MALLLLFDHFASSPEGLTSAAAASQLKRYGVNSLTPRRAESALRQLVRSLLSPLSLVLVAAAVASLMLGRIVDGSIILLMVFLGGLLNFWQTARSSQAIHKLQSQLTAIANVRRDGHWVTVPRELLVPGDVIRLSSGDLVPADVRLLEAAGLHVQQAALTGESFPVEKQATANPLDHTGPDQPALLFVGTSIVSGAGSAVVIATGSQTAFGEIAARLADRPEETAFEQGSRRFGLFIMRTVIALVGFLLLLSLVLGRDPLQSLLFAVALAVGLTPEFLPMISTVTLAHGAAGMARQKVIVRHLEAIQNLGSMEVLCSDKTGTLTSGVVELEAAFDPAGSPSDQVRLLGILSSLHQTSSANALDAALLQPPWKGTEGYEREGEIPFDFERRRASVIVRHANKRLLITKGAPESVLPCCTHRVLDGAVGLLGPGEQHQAQKLFHDLSAEGHRVLAVAYRELESSETDGVSLERGMTFAGLLSFADQMLPDVSSVLADLRDAGVRVKILSGDNELVTQTLCREAGLPISGVVTGAQLDQLNEAEFAAQVQAADVFARVSPAQKHQIILALKHQGRVTGFLGDGINDAPALHAADVGISVAGAAEVAREAADILLLERRLDVLHQGILAGRRSSANILKYLLMATSSNFGNMLSMAVAVFLLPFLPMLPTQILLNNFLYDLSQVTIPTDRVDPAFLRSPQRWDTDVIRSFMLRIGPVSSLFDFLTFAALIYLFRFGESQFQSGWFIQSLSSQVLVLLVIRTAGRPWTCPPSGPLLVTVTLVTLVGVSLPYTPLAGPLGMTPLPFAFLLFVACILPLYLLLVELIKGRVLRGMLAPEGVTV